MLRNLLRPAELGENYEIEDQARAGFVAGYSFLGYVVVNAIADATDTGSILSALIRICGTVFAVGIITSILFTLPKSMRPQKIAMAALCGIGVTIQLIGVSQVMQPVAKVIAMYGLLHLSNLTFLGVLLIYCYCLAKHPYLPTWIGPALLFVTPVWTTYYAQVKTGSVDLWLQILAWGPCIALEIACSIAFIVASNRMLSDAKQRRGKQK
ncbi:hypothetical protein QVA66_08880 [Staphylococcus chromogenes]|nr:hypothetical protein [Staphylococcus chromogenes]